jgi:hypothetical protein
MTLPIQLGAYKDCYTFYERAADSASGIRIPVGAHNKAKTLQMRLHQARALARRQNSRTYPSDHPLHNTSEFDHLQAKLREDTEGNWWVYIEPAGNLDLIDDIEELSDGE